MATRDLINLIKCSGYAGASGQSVRNHVLGAASGAKMTDYIISTWGGWASSPASQGSPGPTFDSGQTFDLSTTILGGSRISYITKSGAGLVTLTNLVKPDSAAVTATGSTVTNTPGLNVGPTVDATVQITSGYNTGSAPGLSASATYFYGGADQSSPPSSGYCQAHFAAVITGGNGISDGGYDDITFTLQLDPNAGTGHFNDVLSQAFTMRMRHRGYNPADFTVEWHTNSTYTNYVSGAFDYYPDEAVFSPSGPPNGSTYPAYTLWFRYKAPGIATWTNYGPVTFTDSRLTY
jgi:hypothetical protein